MEKIREERGTAGRDHAEAGVTSQVRGTGPGSGPGEKAEEWI